MPKKRHKARLYCLIISIITFSNTWASHPNLARASRNASYDHMPITPQTWEEVDLSYFSMINNQSYRNTIALLRPIAWLHAHGMDQIGKSIIFSALEFGVMNAQASIINIRPTQLNILNSKLSLQTLCD